MQSSQNLVDAERVDHIVRIDTGALLNVIRELEIKLSDHHRQDKIPPWAEALIDRVKSLENTASTSSVRSSGGAVAALSLNEFASDERLIVKMRTALDGQLNSTRLGLESKMNSVTFELDRLHKLLQIRPTTSEFQQVVLSINEVQRKMFDSLHDVSTSLAGTVQEKVSTEMDYFLKQLKTNEENHKKSIQIAMKKIDALSNDILNLKIPNNTDALESAVEIMSKDIANVAADIARSKVHQDSQVAGLQYSLTEVRFAQDVTRDLLEDYKMAISSDITHVDEKIKAGGDRVTKIVKEVDERATRTLNSVNEAKDVITALQDKFDFESNASRLSWKSSSDAIYDAAKRIETVEEFLKPQLEIDTAGILKKTENILEHHEKQIKCIEEKMESIITRSVKQMKSVAALQEDLNGSIPDKIGQVNDRLNVLSEETRINEENVKIIELLLRQSQDKLGEVLSLKCDVDNTRETMEKMDHLMRTMKGNLSHVIDSSREIESKMGTILGDLNKSEQGVSRIIEDMRENLFDLIMEKQGEIDADVKNLRENLEIMSQLSLVEMSDRAVGSHVPTPTSSSSGGGSGQSQSPLGPGTTPGTPLLTGPTGSRPLASSPGNTSDISFINNGNRMSDSRPSSGNVNIATSEYLRGTEKSSSHLNQFQNNPNQGIRGSEVLAIPGTNLGLGLSPLELKNIFQQYAISLADICVRFEDISVRKSTVPSLPSVMCDHIVSAAQILSAYISTSVDAEVVLKAIRVQAFDAADGDDDGKGADKRETKIDEFLFSVLAIVVDSHPQTGTVRLDARDRFTKLLRKSLLMCMSRHDQVLVLGNSRLGRVKIPTCIACDRPLVEKMRLDTACSENDGSYTSRADWSRDRNRDREMGFSPSVSRNSSRPPTASSLQQDITALAASLPVLQQYRSGKFNKSDSSLPNDRKGPYLLRGGFRMPRPAKSAFSIETGEIGAFY